MAFEKGAARVEDVLDLKQLIATQTDMQVIKKVLFSKQQRRLIDLQRSRVITLDSSTNDTASSPTHDEEEDIKLPPDKKKEIIKKRLGWMK